MHPDAPIKTTSFNVREEFRTLPVDELQTIAKEHSLPFAIALANVTGDLNTGTTIRTACAMGAERVFIFGKRKYDRRSTVGAHHYIDVVAPDPPNGEDFDWDAAMQTIRLYGYTPVCIEQGGLPLYTCDVSMIPPPPCLVVGAESTGIPRSVWSKELCYEVPQPGIIRSMNVSAAAAIALWHVSCGIQRIRT